MHCNHLVTVLRRGLHCLFLSLFVCVSADQSGRSSGGRSAVRDSDRDEGQQPHPPGHGLLPGQELSLCHVWQSGEQTSSFGCGCQEKRQAAGWCSWSSFRRKPVGSSPGDREHSPCWHVLEWDTVCLAWNSESKVTWHEKTKEVFFFCHWVNENFSKIA